MTHSSSIHATFFRTLPLAAACILTAAGARADVKLSPPFGDHMVLQREMRVPVWGTADPGEKVTVTLADRTAIAVASAEGRWKLSLPPMRAGGPFTMTVTGKNTVSITAVLVGEVWLCSGQSNMEFTLDRATGGIDEAAAANDPQLRMLTVGGKLAYQPEQSVGGEWKVVNPQTAPKMSAVGYFFGKELRKRLGVPVGLINASMGWTPAESWVSREAMMADPELKHDIVDRWDFWIQQFPRAQAFYQKKLADWKVEDDAAKAAGKPEPAQPKAPSSPEFSHRASCLFNGMIAPLIPYAMRGVIWWQGETNVERGYQYRKLFPALIRDWRQRWGQGDFPFLFVQLAAVGDWTPDPAGSRWSELREAQAMTARDVPRTGMVVALDVGEKKDVHPKNKREIGRRLALAALAVAYHQKVAYSGPVYQSMKVDGDRIRIQFTGSDRGLATAGGEPLTGFTVAGADRVFHPAAAVIEGGAVVVSSKDVPEPAAVRYAWLDFPTANLTDSTGLPASPFRTDDWPGITSGFTKTFWDQVGIDDETMTTP